MSHSTARIDVVGLVNQSHRSHEMVCEQTTEEVWTAVLIASMSHSLYPESTKVEKLTIPTIL